MKAAGSVTAIIDRAIFAGECLQNYGYLISQTLLDRPETGG
jgi:hypothetical protein